MMSSQPEIDKLFADAQRHSQRTNFARASNLYERILALQPHRGEIHYHLGRALAERRRYPQAIAEYRTALERGHDPAQVHYALGLALMWTGKYDDAIVEYGKATEISPAFAEAYSEAGHAYRAKADLGAAIAQFETAILHFDQAAASEYHDYRLAIAYRDLAEAHEAKQEYETAFVCLLQGFELDPSNSPVNEVLRRILPKLHALDEAIQKLEAIVRRFDAASAYGEWSLTLLQLGRVEQSIGQLMAAIRATTAVEESPEAAAAFLELALGIKGLQTQEPALEHVRRELDSMRVSWTHCRWAQALAENSFFDDAVHHLEKALLYDLATADVSDPLVTLFRALEPGDPDLTRRHAIIGRLQAVVESSDDAITRTRWGTALCAVEHLEEGLAQFERATKEADLPEANAAWALVLNSKAQFEQAASHFQKAITLALRLGLSTDQIDEWWSGLQRSIGAMKTPPQNLVHQAQEIVEKVGTPAYRVAWARRLNRIGKTDQALTQLDLALHKDAGFEEAYVVLLELRQVLEQKSEFVRRVETLVRKSQSSHANLGWGRVVEGLKGPHVAIEYFERAATLDPEDADAHLAAGNAHSSAKQFVEAIECYVRAIDADPTKSEAYTAWASAIGESDKHEGVIAKLKWALDLAESGDPAMIGWDAIQASGTLHAQRVEALRREVGRNLERSPYADGTQTYIDCGIDLDNQGTPLAALWLLKRASEWAPESHHAHNACGVVLYRLGRYTEASEEFRAAIERDPDDYIAHWNLGQSLSELTQYDGAVRAFSEVSERAKQAERVDFFNDWASALSAAKDYDRALEIAQQALEMNPKNYSTHFRIAYIQADKRFYEQALRHYWEADVIDPKLTHAHHNIADLYQQQGQYGLARKAWIETARLYHQGLEEAVGKRDSSYCLYYGWVLAEVLNQPDRAEAVLRAARLFNPSEPRIHASLASVYLEQQKAARKAQRENGGTDAAESEARARRLAFESYKEARQLLEGRLALLRDANTLKALAELHLLMGEDADAEKEARDLFKEAIGIDPQSARAHKGLGELYLRDGRYDPAIRHLKTSLQHAPDDLSVRANLAKAYLRSGALDEAEFEYQNVLNITRCHVDSLIGLGKLHLEKVDKLGGERDATRQEYFHAQAINLFSKAIEVANSGDRPSTFTESLASAYYLRGYARVQLLNSSRMIPRRALVRDALRDFGQVKPNDADYHKARRAIALIKEESLSGSPRSLMERGSPGFVFVMALFMFAIAQWGFFWGLPSNEEQYALTGQALADFSAAGIEAGKIETLKPMANLPFRNREEMLVQAKELLGESDFTKIKNDLLRSAVRGEGRPRLERMQIGYYLLLGFGALLFIIASAFLPQLTRLKMAGLELEKSTAERVETVRSIGIEK